VIEFQFPWTFLILLLSPLFFRKKGEPKIAIGHGNLNLFQSIPQSARLRWRTPTFNCLRFFIFVLLVIGLARPRIPETKTWEDSEGVDILLVIDTSSSMLAEDFVIRGERFNRLEVVKKVIEEFILDRAEDRMGLMMFAGEAMTLCPLTSDYAVLTDFLKQANIGVLVDGTAIGSALAYATNRLTLSKAKSKVMILLTDGDNNAGKFSPQLGAELAASQSIKVYTIGAGHSGPVPYPIQTPFGIRYQQVEFPLNEEVLKGIASVTGGEYFRASDVKSLRAIYKAINKMEKTKVKTSKSTRYLDVFHWFIIPTLFLFLFKILLSQTYFLKVP